MEEMEVLEMYEGRLLFNIRWEMWKLRVYIYKYIYGDMTANQTAH